MKILILALAVALGRWVWACESDAQIVKPRDIYQGRHAVERDAKGRPITLCGWVHRVRVGSGSALGKIGDVK